MFHELIHYAYKRCITYTMVGEERTRARIYGALSSVVRSKKKTMYEKI
jgi:hypothetical protein